MSSSTFYRYVLMSPVALKSSDVSIFHEEVSSMFQLMESYFSCELSKWCRKPTAAMPGVRRH
eukprot:8186307-Prorocentrum_lima.AAC.1